MDEATYHNAIAASLREAQQQQIQAEVLDKLNRILAILEKPVVEVEGSLSGEGMEAPRKKVK